MIGQIIGNYKIESKLGEGGMGAVYKGVDTMLDREVAIKALKPELASQTSVVERFRSEAVTLAKLNHPNVATLYTMFRQGEELYMVLEFVRGETLDTILQRRGALPAEEAIPVFCQVLDGIDHAHELGIVHRDIKPANMMLTEKGTLKVLDFGIARLLGSARMTRAGNIIGTLEYMAPEQVRGLETDGRSDLYALGMMLYEVLTGKLPFDTDNEFELMKAQTELTPAPPRTLNPNIPVSVEAAIMKAIEKDPNKRFQTGREFREVLLNAGFGATGTIHGMTGAYARPSSRPSSPAPSLNPEATLVMPAAHPSNPAAAFNAEATLVMPAAVQTGNIKETRLGAPAATAAAPAPSAMKATRFSANIEAPAATVPQAAPQGQSFFSKLGVVHYAAAGVIILLLIGGAVAVPFLLMSGGKGSAAANTIETKKAETAAEKPQVVSPPQAPASEQPPLQTSSQGGVPQGGGELMPREDKSADKPVATAKQPAAQKPATPAAKPKPQNKAKLLEKMATGN